MALIINTTGKYADAQSLRYLWIRIKNAFSSQGHKHQKSDITDLPTVAQSGSYNDLTNKPTIPTSLPANGGNADTVDGVHVIITSSIPTSDDRTVMTVVV